MSTEEPSDRPVETAAPAHLTAAAFERYWRDRIADELLALRSPYNGRGWDDALTAAAATIRGAS